MPKVALQRLAKGSLIYGVGGILQRCMTVLLLPFFTRVLSTADYGVVALISLASLAVGGLFNLGTGNSMGVLYFEEKDAEKRPTIIWSNIVLMALNSLILWTILFFLAPLLSRMVFQTEEYANLMRLSFLSLAFTTIGGPFLAYLRMEEKAKPYVVLTLIGSLLAIALSVWFVLIQEIGVMGVILAQTLAQGVMLLVLCAVIGRKMRFRLDIGLFKPLFRVGFPSIFGLFAFLLIDYADRQMLERMVGLDSLGVYSVGYSFGMMMTIAVGAFATAWPPFFNSYRYKTIEANIVFSRVLTYYVIGFGALIVLFFTVAKPIILLFLAPTFHGSHAVVGLVASAYMLKGCYLIVLPGLYFAKKLHLQTIVEWIAAIVNILLNLALIPSYGIIGAAVATLVSYLCLFPLAWIFARKYLHVDYQWGRVFRTVVVVAGSCLAIFWLSFASNLLDACLISFVVGGLFLLLIYFFLLKSDERNWIHKWLPFKF